MLIGVIWLLSHRLAPLGLLLTGATGLLLLWFLDSMGVLVLSRGSSVFCGGWFGVDGLSGFGFGLRFSSLEIAFGFVARRCRPSIHPSKQAIIHPSIHPAIQLLDEVAGFASSTWSRRSRRGSWYWFWAFDAAGISGRAACLVKSILRDHGLGPLRLGLGLSGDSQPAQMRPNAGTCQ
jgi:hypothetical protein